MSEHIHAFYAPRVEEQQTGNDRQFWAFCPCGAVLECSIQYGSRPVIILPWQKVGKA